MDGPKPGIFQQVAAKPPGKQDEVFFFLVSHFDPDLPSLFKTLLILSAVWDRGSLFVSR